MNHFVSSHWNHVRLTEELQETQNLFSVQEEQSSDCVQLKQRTFSSSTQDSQPTDLMKQGQSMARDGDYQGALKKLVECYKMGKRSEGLCYCIGKCYLMLQRTSQADQMFKKELENNNDHTESFYELARLSFLNKNFTNALSYCKQAIVVNRNHKKSLRMLAELYTTFGQDQKGEKIWRHYIDIQPFQWIGYYGLAQSYTKKNQLKMAKKLLIKANSVVLQGKQFLYDKLAWICMQTFKFDQALSFQQLALDFCSQGTIFIINLAKIYYKMQKYRQSMQALNKIKQVQQQNMQEYYAIKSAIMFSLGKVSKSAQCLTHIVTFVKQNRDTVRLHFYQGLINYHNKDYLKSFSHFKTVISQVQSNFQQYYLKNSYVHLSNCLINVNKNQQAVKYLKLGLQQFQQDYLLTYSLANALRLIEGKQHQAIQWFERAIKINSSHAYLYLQYGLLYQKMKKYQKSDEMLNNALKLNSNMIDACKYLGKNCFQQDKNIQGIAFYQKIVDFYENRKEFGQKYNRCIQKLADKYQEIGKTKKSAMLRQRRDKFIKLHKKQQCQILCQCGNICGYITNKLTQVIS